ncbi:MAG: phosphoribosyltransferase, partial [Bacteroidia bacterium]|nr:phosphoribosyltransferase [Bacteroidia bacterium]
MRPTASLWSTKKSLILDSRQIKQKIRRMAFEIYEHNFREKSLVIVGIDGQGYVLAKLLAKEVEQVSPINVKLVKVTLDKLAPQQGEVELDCDEKEV